MILSLRDKMMAIGRLAGRLAGDTAGNVLAMVAAAIIPIAALVGSGVDMSRAYMAQARLQMACDAGALAGRRAMTTGAVDGTVRAEALKFFRFNFPTGESSSTTPPYGVASFTPTVDDGTDSAVVMTASTTVPTTIMTIFGYSSIPISVTCDAKQDFVNTDVMLVLDNTGSMNCLSSESASTYCATEKTGSKMADLRDAVMKLYTTLAPTQALLESHGLRLRYGIVPYSMTVNVGKLLPAGYLKTDDWTYQSRVLSFTQPNYSANPSTQSAPNPSSVTYWEYYRQSSTPQTTTDPAKATTGLNQANCLKFMKNQTINGGVFTKTNPSSGGPAPAATVTISFPNDGAATYGNAANAEWGYSGAIVNNGSNANSLNSCRRQRTDTTTTYNSTPSSYGMTSSANWVYQPASYNLINYAAGSVVNFATNTSGTMPASGSYTVQQMAELGTGFTIAPTATWKGCIEERQTAAATITSSTTDIPSDALDLNLNGIPTSDPNSKWKPYWPEISYYRSANSSSATSGSTSQDACPTQASRLKTWDQTTLQAYVNSLVATGGTYSDIGMAWGGRLLSQTGIFASDNPTSYGNMPVARYLILMTDGYIDTGGSTYNAWGVEQNDRRVSGIPYPGDTTDTSNHMQRFTLLCKTVQSMHVEVWVIAFGAGVGNGLDPTLENCATDKTKAAAVANKDALIAKFEEIGKDIGALRLTK